MAERPRSRAKPLADLIGEVLKPVAAKRGFSQAAILAWWPDIVGETYAATTLPERLRWPRRDADPQGATLVLAVDPSAALTLAHEAEIVRERINTFLGYPAVGAIKFVQRRIVRPEMAPPQRGTADPDALARLEVRLGALDPGLKEALMRLGTSVLADR